MSKGQTLQDPFLNTLRKDRIPVSIFLVNGIKLQGQIESFDQYVVLLKNTVSQMVYKHAISTIVPVRNPRTSDMPASSSYQGGHTPTYPMSGGNSSSGNFAGGSYDRGNSMHNTHSTAGGFSRGGFTRTPPNSGFNSSYERSSNNNHAGGNSSSGNFASHTSPNYPSSSFERNNFDRHSNSNAGFGSGVDRMDYEERGFDGNTFPKDTNSGFDGKDFDEKFFDDDNT